MKTSLRFLPLILVAILFIVLIYLDVPSYLSIDSLQTHQAQLKDWAEGNPIFSWLLSFVIYAAAVAISIPGAAILSIAAGFLYGLVYGSLLVVLAATLGASIIYWIVRMGVGNFLIQRAGPALQKLRDGFNQDAFNYLLVLRLIPVAPFWLLNIASAVMGLSFRHFVLATFLGIIPGSIVFVSLGNGIEVAFAKGETADLNLLTDIRIMSPILALVALSLLQVVYKKWKKGKI